jgi:aminomethyltransferase
MTDESIQVYKTPLYDTHVRLGAKMVEFAKWLLPLWYPTGQTAEHLATRNVCGLFDICHMGEFRIVGPQAKSFLSRMLTNKVDQQADGQAMYHFMLNEAGGVIDDCILYRFDEKTYMLVVNAANTDIDFQWLSDHARNQNVRIKDISERTAKIDLQGPNAPKLLSKWITKETLAGLKFFRFLPVVQFTDMDVLVSRTGYTGEIGFELYADVKKVQRLWDLLLEEGKTLGLLPCGLAARDTLRIEAGLPLHGHELRPDRMAIGHPWEFAIHWNGSFVGKGALVKAKQDGIPLHVYAFSMKGRRKAMSGWEVLKSEEVIGKVLSAVIAPSRNNTPIGFIESVQPLDIGTPLAFRQPNRETLLEGETSATPFVPLSSRHKMEEFLS